MGSTQRPSPDNTGYAVDFDVRDLKFASSILQSGNNFLKIRQMAKIMELHPVSSRLFYAVQNHYICPEVEETFAAQLAKTTSELQGKEVVLCGEYT